MQTSAPTARPIVSLLMLFAAGFSSVAAGELRYESLQAAHAEINLSDVLADAKQLKQRMAAARSAEAALASLDAFASSKKPLPHKEAALFHLAGAYTEGPDSDGRAHSALRWLATYRPQVVVPHPEGRGDVVTAVFPVATRALGAMNELAFAEQYELVSALLRGGGHSNWIEEFAVLDAPRRRATLAAVIEAERVWAKKTLLSLRIENVAPELLAAFAENTQDKALYLAALSRAQNALGSRLLRRAAAVFPEQDALAIVERALQGVSAPVAVAVLGDLAQSSVKAQERLFGLLDNQSLGTAAALALGPLADKTMLQQIEKRLSTTADPGQRTSLLLALKSNKSPLAYQILRQYVAKAADGDPQAAQVKQWIR